MTPDTASPILRRALIAFGLIASLVAGPHVVADELDDQVKAACSGLSARFNNGGPKSDAMDDEIGKAIDGNADLKAVMARARFTGSARACGSDTKAAETRLDAGAAAFFPGSAAKARRLVQIFHCTEARTAREAGSHWDNARFCTQAQSNFDTYVTHNQAPP